MQDQINMICHHYHMWRSYAPNAPSQDLDFQMNILVCEISLSCTINTKCKINFNGKSSWKMCRTKPPHLFWDDKHQILLHISPLLS